MIFTGARIYYAMGKRHRLFAPLAVWNVRLRHAGGFARRAGRGDAGDWSSASAGTAKEANRAERFGDWSSS